MKYLLIILILGSFLPLKGQDTLVCRVAFNCPHRHLSYVDGTWGYDLQSGAIVCIERPFGDYAIEDGDTLVVLVEPLDRYPRVSCHLVHGVPVGESQPIESPTYRYYRLVGPIKLIPGHSICPIPWRGIHPDSTKAFLEQRR